MKPAYTLVRDALPIERISCARIRQWLADDPQLGSWSRSEPAAIRPQRLAALIRDRIWEAHDVTLGTVRERLDRGGDTQHPGHTDYWVKVEIEKEPDKEVEVLSRTRFTLTPSGRICADIGLGTGAEEQSITDGPVPLRRREES